MNSQNSINATSPELEVIKSMEGFLDEQLPSLLCAVNESWQPSDFLPDLTNDGWMENLMQFRQQASCLPDEVLVVLVGDMVTEEALPTYQTWLNRLRGVTDQTGTSSSPWARWSRGWTVGRKPAWRPAQQISLSLRTRRYAFRRNHHS